MSKVLRDRLPLLLQDVEHVVKVNCCRMVDSRSSARQTVWLACVRQGQTASPFNWRSASLSQLRIVWLLTLTMLAVHSCVLMELAVAVLSPSDVRMTKWSSCLVAVRGP